MTLNYFNIQKFSLHDGPGIRTNVFLKGCPLHCLWCHNPESHNMETELMFKTEKCTSCGRCDGLCEARSFEDGILVFDREKCKKCGKCSAICPNRAPTLCGKSASAKEILSEVEKDKLFYDNSGGGMTISGGEPAFQSEGVLELTTLAREKGISVAIETCGYGDEAFFKKCAEAGCLFLYDIKGIDNEKHKKNTGVGTEKIHRNLEMLMDMGAQIILRLPLIPGYNDDERDLELLRDFLQKHKGRYDHAEIMPYHNLGVGKLRSLGRQADESVPLGHDFCSIWLEKLNTEGVEIIVSGE